MIMELSQLGITAQKHGQLTPIMCNSRVQVECSTDVAPQQQDTFLDFPAWDGLNATMLSKHHACDGHIT